MRRWHFSFYQHLPVDLSHPPLPSYNYQDAGLGSQPMILLSHALGKCSTLISSSLLSPDFLFVLLATRLTSTSHSVHSKGEYLLYLTYFAFLITSFSPTAYSITHYRSNRLHHPLGTHRSTTVRAVVLQTGFEVRTLLDT